MAADVFLSVLGTDALPTSDVTETAGLCWKVSSPWAKAAGVHIWSSLVSSAHLCPTDKCPKEPALSLSGNPWSLRAQHKLETFILAGVPLCR